VIFFGAELLVPLLGGKMHMNSRVKDYRNLLIWQKGMALAKLIYQLTANFPKEEKYGLVSQMRLAAVSIPSNIAEGQAHHGTGEFLRFLSHAEGSTAELDTQILLCIELDLCQECQIANIQEMIRELRKMFLSLRRKLSSP